MSLQAIIVHIDWLLYLCVTDTSIAIYNDPKKKQTDTKFRGVHIKMFMFSLCFNLQLKGN